MCRYDCNDRFNGYERCPSVHEAEVRSCLRGHCALLKLMIAFQGNRSRSPCCAPDAIPNATAAQRSTEDNLDQASLAEID